jgi:hypothetical protein
VMPLEGGEWDVFQSARLWQTPPMVSKYSHAQTEGPVARFNKSRNVAATSARQLQNLHFGSF